MNDPPRCIYAESYRLYGDEALWGDHLLLVEQPDGSWRKATGTDITKFHERYPGVLSGSLPRR